MKRTIAKGIFLVALFILAINVISHFINRGNTDMTMEMGPATYPIVSVNLAGSQVNCLHGYTEIMETNYLKETITPLTNGRQVSLTIDKFDNSVSGLAFEVRNIDGSRLIENADITDLVEDKETITANFSIKDLIESNTEYTLVILVTLNDGKQIRYYTRIVYPENYYVEEKLDFVLDFSEKTFSKEAAKDLTKYLESNAEGDNTTYSKVNIHSSFNQVTWGNLNITRETRPSISIKELAEQTGSFALEYEVSTTEGKDKTYYNVREFYRVRYTSERIYLLEFERTMSQKFDTKAETFVKNKIMLGITDSQVELVESDGDNVFAFIINNQLYSYNIADNKLALLFAFQNEKNQDVRTKYQGHHIKILNVDEAGNVAFMVYGYMNRGRHEGCVGVSTYYYSSTVNTVEEMVYLPYYKSEALLEAEVEQLAYVNRTGTLYLMFDNAVYAVNLETRNYEVIVSGLREGCYQVSESNRMLVWQKEEEPYQGNQLILMNLNTGEQVEINAGTGEAIAPLGFMGEDLIYGIARKNDIVRDNTGNTVFPMYCVRIQNEIAGILKEYAQADTYIVGCEIIDNQITLHRVTRQEEAYVGIEDDQIVNSEAVASASNYVETVVTENYEKIVQIAVKDEINKASLKELTPKEVLFEGGRLTLLSDMQTEDNRYYVYGKNDVEGIFMDAGNAINLAYDISGVVVNDSGSYIWKKGNRSTKNQIMAITGELVSEDRDSLAVCLDTMLSYEGISRNSAYMLRQGETVLSILGENLENASVLDLTGCSLDAVLYYVNQDIPVLATLEDGNAVLIVGFNELNVVIMDPQTGEVFKMGMEDTTKWLEENGNCFITYTRNE